MSVNEKKEDRIGFYLTPQLDEFLFDELSESYLQRAGVADILSGVPIPLRKTALDHLTTLDIARNMAFVLGCDPQFQYAENYRQYILRTFGKKFAEGLIGDGVEGAAREDYIYACIQFRAAMQIDPEKGEAYYCYGRACKDAYEAGDEEEYIGRYKAEALEAFEVATLKKPDFADAYYFLGYAYLNLGLYVKAKLTFEQFLQLTAEPAEGGAEDAAGREAAGAPDGKAAQELRELRQEVEERVASLAEPVEIEKGYNLVLSGRYVEGVDQLTPYKTGKYANWWPLWYYLGMAYSKMGLDNDAIEHFLQVLKLSPSNSETMEELVKLYESRGDAEKAEKYRRKIGVVKQNAELDRAARGKQS